MKTKQSILAFTVLIAAMLACQSLPLSNQQPASVAESVQAIAPIISNAENPASPSGGLVALYENVSPGTVAIITDQGQGSGFVYDGQGHVITNFHVVEGATTIEIRFMSGFMSYGTLVGTDTDSDLAIVKVKHLGGFPNIGTKYLVGRSGQRLLNAAHTRERTETKLRRVPSPITQQW